MATFLETIDCGVINLDLVTHYRRYRDGKIIFWTKDGESFQTELLPGIRDQLESMRYDERTAVIQSPPGYTLLCYWKGSPEEPESVQKQDVLAWRIDLDGDFHKAFGAWLHSDEQNVAVLCPDGSVVEPGNARFATEQDWLKERRAVAAKEDK